MTSTDNGGDFNKYDASDNNFNDNGLISPDRRPNPHAMKWDTSTSQSGLLPAICQREK